MRSEKNRELKVAKKLVCYCTLKGGKFVIFPKKTAQILENATLIVNLSNSARKVDLLGKNYSGVNIKKNS